MSLLFSQPGAAAPARANRCAPSGCRRCCPRAGSRARARAAQRSSTVLEPPIMNTLTPRFVRCQAGMNGGASLRAMPFTSCPALTRVSSWQAWIIYAADSSTTTVCTPPSNLCNFSCFAHAFSCSTQRSLTTLPRATTSASSAHAIKHTHTLFTIAHACPCCLAGT